MNYVSKFLSNFKEFYNDINSATLTGAIDVVIVRQQNGSYTCSPFHVRFGKIGVLRSKEKIVDIEINGEPVDIHMKLGETGEAFFVEETSDPGEVPSHLATSPIPPLTEIGRELHKLHISQASKQQHDRGPPDDVPIVITAGIVAEGKDVFITVEDLEGSKSLQGSVYHEVSETAPLGSPTKDMNELPFVLPLEECNLDENKVASPNDPLVPSLDLGTESEEVIQLSSIRSTTFFEDQREFDSSNTIDASKSETVPFRSYEETTSPSLENSSNVSLSIKSSLSSSVLNPVTTNVDGSILSNAEASSTYQVNFSLQKTIPTEPMVTLESSSFGGEEDKLKTKKKRRKRSVVRKKKSRETQESSDESEEIFQMDVDDEMESRKKPNFQLPQPAFKSLASPRPISSSLEKGMNNNPSSFAKFEKNLPSATSGPHSWQYSSSLQLNFESHPFSDGDVTPIMSPVTSRPPTPKSDTEYEILKQENASQTDTGDNRWSWTWGQLPVPPKTPLEMKREPPVSDDESLQAKHREPDEDEQRSMLGGMFRFMRKTKKMRHQPESEGIYLQDLNFEQLDPEIARLYFPPRNTGLRIQSSAISTPSRVKDEDVESGNGSSLPQSPQSMEGCLGSIQGIDSDNEERHPIFEFKGYNDLAISMCGGLAEFENDIPADRFLHSLVTYDDFCENPSVLQNPDLVVRLNKKYYNWKTVAPILMALVLYQRPPSDKTVDRLVQENMPKKAKKMETKGYSWFSWRRAAATDEPTEKKDEKKNDGLMKLDLPSMSADHAVDTPDSSGINAHSKASHDARNEESAYASTSSETEDIAHPSEDQGEMKRSRGEESIGITKGKEKFKKTLRLSSEQISKLNLHEGPNEVVFSVTTAYQGTTRCKCHIYLWQFDDKVVVSDIDGTITKSDVLGHILPIIGKDWAQSGVAQLFTKIKNNGFQFLYLSARAIGQAHITREYLKSIRQGDLCLPEGPLLLNPSSLISAFHREVIEKKPEEFKISCLKDIQALFPLAINPFYAGYGNKVNDVWAYRAVGIPMTRIFTINYRGELKHELTHSFQSTYTGLSSVVDHLFPPLRRSEAPNGHLTTDFEGSDEYSYFTYWRQPLPEVSLDSSENSKKSSPRRIVSKVKIEPSAPST